MPLWVKWSPFVAMATRLRRCLVHVYIKNPSDMPEKLAEAAVGCSTSFLLNKWYFDELYDFLFVRSAKASRPLPVEEG